MNKAQIEGEFHGNATWGASQAGIAKAVVESLEDGTLPPEAENEWVVVSANWVNPKTDDLDTVYRNNYRAAKHAIQAAMLGLPGKEEVFAASRDVSNPFYTPNQR
ncbi:Formaldehyde-activating enzyme (Fae) [Caballeronia terrestris]|uniref:Formaldehyde-activating enzyme (Fae) n=1 Tax=Caballeronia terrestris TaxID=1226301 RepID=A0A158JVC0_9BURK|nr:Formaldehyde-activating enzyme (Fae) [Caballeronia terrestris]